MALPNDWQIKKCLAVSLSLLLAMFILIGLAALGFDIPCLRQIVGFLLVTFVPGILLLRIFKIHNISIIESLLYSVGLSLAFAMAVGVVANFALPPLGIPHPITLAPLTITFTALLLLLCFLAYVRDKDFQPVKSPHKSNEVVTKQGFFSTINPFLLAILLPIIAALGANLANSYHNNFLIFVLIFIVIVITALVAFNKFIPPRVYPFMVFMMAVALLYQTTLISDYVVGSDIHLEYRFANLVLETGYWDATISWVTNSCLSIVILAPVYSLFMKTGVGWLFKAVYPLMFALVPLAIFYILQLQIKARYAFLTALFFLTMPMFFMDLAQLVRQQVAEFFFALVILLMIDRKLTMLPKTILAIIFSFGIAVSHYGMGTGVMVYLVLGGLLIILIKSRLGRAIWQWLVGKKNELPADLTSAGSFTKKALAILVCSYLIFSIAYYAVVASGRPSSGPLVVTNIIETAGQELITGVTTDKDITPGIPLSTPSAELPGFVQDIIARFPSLSPFTKEPLVQTALGLDFASVSSGGKIWRILQYLVELFIVVGFIRLIFRPKTLEFRAEYFALNLVAVLSIIGLFILPGVSYGMGATRIFHIALILTAPLFLVGGEVIVYGIVKLARVFRKSLTSSRLSLGSPVLLQPVILVVLIPYFIFNSGVIFELSQSQPTGFVDMPYSIALSSYRADIIGASTTQDHTAVTWLSAVATEDQTIYSDYHGCKILGEQIPVTRQRFPAEIEKISLPTYIYFRAWNIREVTLTFAGDYGTRQSVSFDNVPGLTPLIESGDRIYNNGAQVLLIK
jgi:uncharacterized membrane protein